MDQCEVRRLLLKDIGTLISGNVKVNYKVECVVDRVELCHDHGRVRLPEPATVTGK